MEKRTPKYIEAVEMLPPELIPVFDELYTHYKFASFKVHGREFCSPLVIAELVLMGWRDVGEPLKSTKK